MDIRTILAILAVGWAVTVAFGIFVQLRTSVRQKRWPARVWAVCMLLLSAVTFLYSRPGLRIVSPSDGLTVSSGHTVTFEVQPSFARDFEYVTLVGEPSLGFVPIKQGPPPFTLPLEFQPAMPPGDYKVCAVGRREPEGRDQGRSLCLTIHLVKASASK